MVREIEDLKEKIFMCREEYKALYIEKNKLHRKLEKAGKSIYTFFRGVQWLSGRVLDLRPRGHRFKPHRVTALWSLSKTHLS